MLIKIFFKIIKGIPILLLLAGCQGNQPVSVDNTLHGNFTGKICNTDGSPIKNAAVYLVPDGYSAYSSNNMAIDSTTSNESGMYAFQVKNSGTFNLLATDGSRSAFKKSISVNTKSVMNLEDQRLTEGGSLNGTVHLQGMRNHSSAVIILPGTNIYTIPTDSTGNFLIPNLPQGTYTLRFLTTNEGFAITELTITVLSGKTTPVEPVEIPKKRYPVIENFKADYNNLTMYATLSWTCSDTDMIDSFRIYCNREKNITPVKTVDRNTLSVQFDHLSLTTDTFTYQIAALGTDGWEGEAVSATPFVNKFPLSIKKYPVPDRIGNGLGISTCHINKYGIYALRFTSFEGDELDIIKLDTNLEFQQMSHFPILLSRYCTSVSSDKDGNLFILDQDSTDGHYTLFKFDKDLVIIDSLVVLQNDTLDYFSFAVTSSGNILLYNTVGGPFEDYNYNRANVQLTIAKVYDSDFNLISDTSYNERRTIVDSWCEGDRVSAIIYSDSWLQNRVCDFDQSFNCLSSNNTIVKLINDVNYVEIMKTGFLTKDQYFADCITFPPRDLSVLYIYNRSNEVVARYQHMYAEFYPHAPGKAIFSDYNGTFYSFEETKITKYKLDLPVKE